MSGRIIRVLEKTDFDWGGNTIAANTVVNAAAMVVGIDVSASRETVVLVRGHSMTGAGTGYGLKISVYADAPTSEDPGVIFRDTGIPLINAANLGTPGPAPAATGTLYRGVVTNPGGWITIVITANQGNAAGLLKGTLSIDVSLKD